MKKLLLSIVFLCATVFTEAQNWEPAGITIENFDTRCIYTDTINNYIYVSGGIGINDFIIYRYNGSTWDTLGGFNDQVLTMIEYNGQLIVGGFFSSVNGQPDSGIAMYDGTNWHPFGNFYDSIGPTVGTILNLRIINGELYACGEFNRVDSINANSIAKWNGTHWTDVYNFPNIAWQLNDVVMYNNVLYVGGNWDSLTRSLIMYENGTWQQVGQGITGSSANIWKMLVYNNELYIGGDIMRSEGNIGNGIQKWNGTTWTQAGTSLQDENDSYNNFLQVEDMKIYNNELYVCGTFNFAGNAPAKAIAKWNGVQWCGFGTNEFTNYAGCLGFYNDTMYLGYDNDSLNGVFEDDLIKWTGGSYVDTCSSPTGIKDNGSESLLVLVFPNPTNTTLNIHLSSYTPNETLLITDVLGEVIYKNTLSGIDNNIDVSKWSEGVYFITIKSQVTNTTQKFIKL